MTVIIHCAASSLSVYYRAQFWAPLKPLIFSKPALFLIGRMIPWASQAKLFSAAELVFRAQTALSCQEAMYVIEKFHRSLCHWVTSPPPSEKPNEFRHITQVLPTLLPLHIHHQPVLRSPSAAPQQKHIPALCELYKSSWKCTRQALETSKAGGRLNTAVSVQQDTWVQAHLIIILLQRTCWRESIRQIVRLVCDAPHLVGALVVEYKIYTHIRMHFTMSTFLHVIIYEIFWFLEKDKIHSSGPQVNSVLTLL